MSATIFELEEKFKQDMSVFSILDYAVHESSVSGNRILYGKHITLYYSANFTLSKAGIENLKKSVEKYYGKVKRVLRPTHTISHYAIKETVKEAIPCSKTVFEWLGVD